MNGYRRFSHHYDALIDMDYQKYFAYLERLFTHFSCSPATVLELGCGTGNLTELFVGAGYDMVALDLSSDMLSIAQQKLSERFPGILFLNADMCDFELYGTVGAAVAALDGVNHVRKPGRLLECFRRVHLFLEPGGLFLFDMNTEYKLEHILGQNSFVYETPDVTCVWQNSFDPQKRECEFDLTFFERSGELYRRFDETYHERAYGAEEIERMLRTAGFEKIRAFHEFTLQRPKKTSERVFWAAAKKKQGEL